ncbi:MAG: hypothetical protein HQK84_12430 [Nitrospinae bacterium]|nr:hypothetical protein [Nitrospinota bacterium]
MKNKLSPETPVGFVSVDVDLYSSAKDCLKLFQGEAECYLPAVINWFDDVEHAITMNSWCGEALAIKEFNEANNFRKIEKKQVRTNRPQKWWHHQFYFAHILDHPVRTGEKKAQSLSINMFEF